VIFCHEEIAQFKGLWPPVQRGHAAFCVHAVQKVKQQHMSGYVSLFDVAFFRMTLTTHHVPFPLSSW
jgi:hypothetical protein